MDVGSAGAGSVTQNVPTQTGSQPQVVQAEQQQETLNVNSTSENAPQAGERVGSQINISV
ncbi:hypothetical protein RS130_20305 [Paraglaciecola aquimarina]|uniref:Uncharacterized protein n=1 Tax=Paraglaciecola aquimarina TaxID=1235557 RepID=A0ABU3T0W7_9ALTE|nr:hypothetical protein [Paraglaciecola aquimarina]MDU0355915.1 hypothetical protein [Paraglaciecola aquimarina]